jgi:MoxR-like ATPase
MAAAWKMGGRQAAKVNNADAITKGTDKIVDSTEKLIDLFKQLAESERIKANTEVEHRMMCEKALAEHKQRMDVLENKYSEENKALRKEIEILKKKV